MSGVSRRNDKTSLLPVRTLECCLLLWNEHGGASDFSVAQMSEGFVGFLQSESLHRGFHRYARSDEKKFFAVPAREVCDGTDAALVPEGFVRERRNVTHVDAA